MTETLVVGTGGSPERPPGSRPGVALPPGWRPRGGRHCSASAWAASREPRAAFRGEVAVLVRSPTGTRPGYAGAPGVPSRGRHGWTRRRVVHLPGQPRERRFAQCDERAAAGVAGEGGASIRSGDGCCRVPRCARAGGTPRNRPPRPRRGPSGSAPRRASGTSCRRREPRPGRPWAFRAGGPAAPRPPDRPRAWSSRSELLGEEQRQDQVPDEADRDDDAYDVLRAHPYTDSPVRPRPHQRTSTER